LPGFGMSGPYTIGNWLVNGTVYMANTVANINDIVDSLNLWDPNGNWELDTDNYMINGGDPNNTYGDLTVVQSFSGIGAQMVVSFSLLPTGTALSLESGVHNINVTYDGGCIDNMEVTVVCMTITTDQINESVLINDTDTVCLSLDELMGIPVSITNVCEDQSGEMVLFESLGPDCVTYTGVETGIEDACFVICDEFGICDTTYISVEVDPNNFEDELPFAFDDIDSTFENQTMLTNIYANDFIFGEFDTLYLLTPPVHGSATIMPDFTLEYTPNEGYCNGGAPDSMSYVLCNTVGCDTAQVYIYTIGVIKFIIKKDIKMIGEVHGKILRSLKVLITICWM